MSMVYCLDRYMDDKSHCIEQFDGSLINDYEVCFLQYYCESCPQYDDVLCDNNCNKTGTAKKLADINGCKTTNSKCECKCIESNCNIACNGTDFILKKNNFGCYECECVYPRLICGDSCDGKEPKDAKGCFTTGGECEETNG